MADNKQNLGFSHDESINGPVIVVTNSQTGEVVRKIPTEEVIRVAHSIDALKGVLFSSKI
jgi:flagellar protein FlaG